MAGEISNESVIIMGTFLGPISTKTCCTLFPKNHIAKSFHSFHESFISTNAKTAQQICGSHLIVQ